MSFKDKLMKRRGGVPMAGVVLLVALLVTAGGVGALIIHQGETLATTEHNPIEFNIEQSEDVVTQGEWSDAVADIHNPHNATYTVTVDYSLEHNLDAKDVGLACNVTVKLPTGDYINGDDLLNTIYSSNHTLSQCDSVVEEFKIMYHGPAVNQTLYIELMGDVHVDKIHGPECPIDEPVECVTSDLVDLTDAEGNTLCIGDRFTIMQASEVVATFFWLGDDCDCGIDRSSRTVGNVGNATVHEPVDGLLITDIVDDEEENKVFIYFENEKATECSCGPIEFRLPM